MEFDPMRSFEWPAIVALTVAVAACTGGSPAGPPDLADPNSSPRDFTIGPPPDMTVVRSCTLPDGRVCSNPFTGVGSCPWDSCNWCSCSTGCTVVACNDGGARPDGAPDWPRCRDQSDCPATHACLFDQGCGET